MVTPRVQRGSESLTVVTKPTRGYWRSDTPAEFVPNQPYVYNDSSTNRGGQVPSTGMNIDGYFVPGGTYVAQFCDLSASDFYCSGSNRILFRGCRFRNRQTAPGSFNDTTNNAPLYIFYCDMGGLGAADSQYNEIPIKISGSAGSIIYRNYISYTTTGIQVNASNCEVVENYVHRLSYYYGSSGPPNESTDKHLNGFTSNGGMANILLLRNVFLLESPDDAGRTIDQTDAISFFQDFGAFNGSGRNRDGTLGYQVKDNYVGGGGYCVYAGQNAGSASGSVRNMVLTGNKISTKWWPRGGYFGAITAEPPWGSYGNLKSGNTFAGSGTAW